MHFITIFNHGKFEFFALYIALISRKSLESLYIFGTEGSTYFNLNCVTVHVRRLLSGTGSRPKLPSAVADQPRLADNKERADKEVAKPKKQPTEVDAELTSSSESDEPVDVGA